MGDTVTASDRWDRPVTGDGTINKVPAPRMVDTYGLWYAVRRTPVSHLKLPETIYTKEAIQVCKYILV